MINWISASESPFQTLLETQKQVYKKEREKEKRQKLYDWKKERKKDRNRNRKTKAYVALRKKENTFSQI